MESRLRRAFAKVAGDERVEDRRLEPDLPPFDRGDNSEFALRKGLRDERVESGKTS